MDVHRGSQEQETGDLLLLVDCSLQFLLLRWYKAIRRLDLNTRARDWRPFAHGLFFTVPLTFGQIFSRLCISPATHSVGTKDTRRLNFLSTYPQRDWNPWYVGPTSIGRWKPLLQEQRLETSCSKTISSIMALFPTAIHQRTWWQQEYLFLFKVPVKDLLIFQFNIYFPFNFK